MVSTNSCPITRSSYTSLFSQILEAATGPDKSSSQPIVCTREKTHDSPAPIELFTEALNTDNWRYFTEYLRQPCPEKSAFAIENAAKALCRTLVDCIEQHCGKTSSPGFHPLPPTLLDYGLDRSPRDPEHSDHLLRESGKSMAMWLASTGWDSASTNEKLQCWARALKVAQGEGDVSFYPYFLKLPAVLK